MNERYRLRFDWRCGHWRSPEFFHQSCWRCSHIQRRKLDVLSAPAHRAVKRAIERGDLPRLDGSIACMDCGRPATIYDHRAYARPLDVDPVCKRCNHRRGPAIEHAAIARRPWAFRSPARTLQ